nr:hypothetical protein ANI_1_1604094 [Aspergillus niger CBS 513.88]|eukprot:XP_003188834.1 hypothetical protein ANI_1_1604094 [Aspergillus niger CBS 513.88]
MPLSDHAPRLEFLKGSASALNVLRVKGKPSNAGRAGKASSDGATILKCLRCRRRTIKPVRRDAARPALPPKATSTAASTPDIQSSSAVTTPQSEPATEMADQSRVNKAADNANSKKRAKARKQGGLQALMASKQQSRSNSSSLDLFDFLQ